MTYIELKQGDVRQIGDEVKHKVNGTSIGGDSAIHEQKLIGWQPVRLVGHPILAVDLIAATYRRPVK